MKLRRLLLGRKVMTNIDSILKSRNITLPTKVRLVKAMVFPVVMYGCESWTVKKAEHWRIDAFELWCWIRLLRVPWTKEIQPVHPNGDQSWVFIGRTDAKAETPILWPPHAKSWLIGKDPNMGGIGGRRRGQQRMRWLGGIIDSMDMSWVTSGNWLWTRRPGVLWFMGSQRVGHDWDGTELNYNKCWAHFYVPVGHVYVFFGGMTILVFSLVFDFFKLNWIICFYFCNVSPQ